MVRAARQTPHLVGEAIINIDIGGWTFNRSHKGEVTSIGRPDWFFTQGVFGAPVWIVVLRALQQSRVRNDIHGLNRFQVWQAHNADLIFILVLV
jgi:hypothetical protein